MKSTVTLKEGMHFHGGLEGFDIPLDADEKFGGKNKGVKPKDLVLTSIAGCTAMDVLSILRKMRLEPEALSVEASGDYVDEHPKIFKSIHLVFRIKGDGMPIEKVKQAVDLSQKKYCGVTAMLKAAVPITSDIHIEK